MKIYSFFIHFFLIQYFIFLTLKICHINLIDFYMNIIIYKSS